MEPNGAERAERSRTSRAEPSGAERSRAEPSGAERSRAEPSGAERSRAKPSEAEWAGYALKTQTMHLKSSGTIVDLSVQLESLQERMRGPRYDVMGPWPVCPSQIAELYPN